jgi:hypothetical protein
MPAKKEKELIDSYYERLHRALYKSHPSLSHHLFRLFKLNESDERNHRRFTRPHSSGDYKFSVSTSAKYFCLKWILEFLFDGDVSMPTLGDYLTIRPSVFLAAAVAVEFEEIIKKVFSKKDYEVFQAIEYVNEK